MEGIIPLWKPRGMTSHDCVFRLRKILKTKKIGHSGTLDPDVEGVLPICVGRATKVVEYLQDSRKVYLGEVTLGFSTETEDSSGEVVQKTPVLSAISNEMIDETMQSFLGDITQIPPMYSAVKVNGRRLYDYARKGEVVERPVRTAHIYEYIRLGEPVYHDESQTQSWTFKVDCGKGTYVRTLAVDTGEKLGYAAHMSNLARIFSGGFSKSESVTLEQVETAVEMNQMDDLFYPMERAVADFPRIDLTNDQYQILKNGVVIPKDYFAGYQVEEPVALFLDNQLISLYGPHPTKSGQLKPVKVFKND